MRTKLFILLSVSQHDSRPHAGLALLLYLPPRKPQPHKLLQRRHLLQRKLQLKLPPPKKWN